LGGIGDTFSLISIFYLFVGAYTVYQLARNWRTFWDDNYTAEDRNLAGLTAFFLLVPLGVLLHEFGHMLAVWHTGGTVEGLGYFLYWGYVTYIPATSDNYLHEWYIALAGNFVSYALGIACLAVAYFGNRLKRVVRAVLYQLGILEILQTLIFYPLLSLATGFEGDWDTIYSFNFPAGSAATLAVHLLSLVAFFLVLRSNRFSSVF